MPTREEKAAQIEAALQMRFFGLIPKVETSNRSDWTEERHNTDRLSRALAAFTLVGTCGLDDVAAAYAVTDGENDGGIDAFHFDRDGNRLYIVQSKFKRKGECSSQDENNKTVNGIKALHRKRFQSFNAAFQTRLDEIEEAFRTPGLKIVILHSYLGENFSPHVRDDLNAFCEEMTVLHSSVEWEEIKLTKLYEWLLLEQTTSIATVKFTLEHWAAVMMPRKAIYGLIRADRLAELVSDNGKALFERNIRHYLGSLGVNMAIEETVRRYPHDLFYLNNGITAVAEIITHAPALPERCEFEFINFSIVNGAQTAGSIANAALGGTLSPDAKLLITIIEIGQSADDIGLKITQARNRQNFVRGVYFAALDPHQERLRKELKIVGIDYFYRPSAESLVRREDAFTLEEAAIALACCSLKVLSAIEMHILRREGKAVQNAVDFVVAAKKEVGRLWEQESTLYKQLFSESLSGLRLYRIIRLYRFVDAILAEAEHTESDYHRRMFFRHGRYFITAFVAHRSPEILASTAMTLSKEEKKTLSLRVNEISEIIYLESEPLQDYRGYLAIFRNLTEAQPLADDVLAHLEHNDNNEE